LGGGPAGGSVVVVEHNLELIRAADWVIGQIVAEGAPEAVAQVSASYTGQFLKALAGL
jgi:excinuclease ABC subunit A